MVDWDFHPNVFNRLRRRFDSADTVDKKVDNIYRAIVFKQMNIADFIKLLLFISLVVIFLVWNWRNMDKAKRAFVDVKRPVAEDAIKTALAHQSNQIADGDMDLHVVDEKEEVMTGRGGSPIGYSLTRIIVNEDGKYWWAFYDANNNPHVLIRSLDESEAKVLLSEKYRMSKIM